MRWENTTSPSPSRPLGWNHGRDSIRLHSGSKLVLRFFLPPYYFSQFTFVILRIGENTNKVTMKIPLVLFCIRYHWVMLGIGIIETSYFNRRIQYNKSFSTIVASAKENKKILFILGILKILWFRIYRVHDIKTVIQAANSDFNQLASIDSSKTLFWSNVSFKASWCIKFGLPL